MNHYFVRLSTLLTTLFFKAGQKGLETESGLMKDPVTEHKSNPYFSMWILISQLLCKFCLGYTSFTLQS